MDLNKQLGKAIELATSQQINESPITLYDKILGIINSRVDMPKNTVNAISKRLSYKNKNILYQCFDLLEYLSFRCQLALYSQISTKEFLLKISGLLMNQELDPIVHKKILQTVRSWEELFRPHQDLLPMYFQFYAGILRKEFPIQTSYVSPHRPKDFKIYKKKQSKNAQQNKQRPAKKTVQPTKSQQKTFEQIREKLLLTNEIIDSANPADSVKNNEILLEMMQEIKASEKKINQTINQNPNQYIMELALALNDDIFITYRRFKELQKNRKPQPFILTQLQSQIIKDKQNKKQKQMKAPDVSSTKKIQQKKSSQQIDIFKVQQNKSSKQINILDIACQPKQPEVNAKTSLIDLDLNLGSTNQNNTQKQPNIYELIGAQSKEVPNSSVPSPNLVQQGNYIGNFNFTSVYMSPQNPNPYQSNTFNSNMPGILNQSNLGLNPNNSTDLYGTSFGSKSSNDFTTQNDFKLNPGKSLVDQLIDMTDMLKK